MSRRKSALAIILAIAMCFTMMPTMAFAGQAGVTKNLVCFGDSTSSGYALEDFVNNNCGYDESNTDLDNYSPKDARDAGRGRISNSSFPWRLKKEMEKDGSSVKLDSYCLNGLRSDELRGLLDYEYYEDTIKKEAVVVATKEDDGRTRGFFTDHMRAFIDSLGCDESWNSAEKKWNKSNWEAANAKVAGSVKNADVVVLDICMNNFGTYLAERVVGSLGLIDSYDYAAGYYRQGLDDIDDLDAKTRSQCKVIKTELLKAYGADIEGKLDAQTQKLVTTFVDSFIYCYADCVTNFDACVELVKDLNPTAKIIVVGTYNGMEGVKFEMSDGSVLNIGDATAKYFSAVNTYLKGISDESPLYYYADYSAAANELAKKLDDDATIEEFDAAYSTDILNRYTDLSGDCESFIDQIAKMSINKDDKNYYANEGQMDEYLQKWMVEDFCNMFMEGGYDAVKTMADNTGLDTLINTVAATVGNMKAVKDAGIKIDLQSTKYNDKVAELKALLGCLAYIQSKVNKGTVAEKMKTALPEAIEEAIQKDQTLTEQGLAADEEFVAGVTAKVTAEMIAEAKQQYMALDPKNEQQKAVIDQCEFAGWSMVCESWVKQGIKQNITKTYGADAATDTAVDTAYKNMTTDELDAANKAAWKAAEDSAKAQANEFVNKKLLDLLVAAAQVDKVGMSLMSGLSDMDAIVEPLMAYVTDTTGEVTVDTIPDDILMLIHIVDRFMLCNGIGQHPSKNGVTIKANAVVRAYQRAMAGGYTAYEETFRDALYTMVGIYEILSELPSSEETQALIKQAQEAQQMLEEYKAKAQQLATITAMEIEYLDTTIKTLQQEVQILKDENEATKAELKVLKKRIAALELKQLELKVTKKNVLTADEATTVISWNAEDWNLEDVEEDAGFLVSKNGGEAEDVGFESSYEDTEAVVGTKATYTVTPYVLIGDDVVKGAGVTVTTTPTAKIGAVKSFKVTGTTKGVKATWTKASKATGYVVYYGTSKKSLNKVTVTKTAKTIKGLTAGKSYVVKVKPYRTVAGKNYYGKATAYKTATAK